MKLQRLLCDHKSGVGTYRILTIFIAGAGLGNVYFLEYTFVENPVNIWWMSYFTHGGCRVHNHLQVEMYQRPCI